MNLLLHTSFVIDHQKLSEDVASFLLGHSRLEWERFGSFTADPETPALSSKHKNQGGIIVFTTDSKEDLSQHLTQFRLKYPKPTFLILGDLSEISLAMQQGLLRFTEEPPDNLNLILTTTSQSQVLSTISSRFERIILPFKISLKYLDSTKNIELAKVFTPPKTLIDKFLKSQQIPTPDFKQVSREGLSIWLWQLEYTLTEILLQRGYESRLSGLLKNVTQAKILNQANVLNRLVWAMLDI